MHPCRAKGVPLFNLLLSVVLIPFSPHIARSMLVHHIHDVVMVLIAVYTSIPGGPSPVYTGLHTCTGLVHLTWPSIKLI